MQVYLASAEDVVLSKIEWGLTGASPRQLEDARSVVRATGDALDRPYLATWGRRLGIVDALADVLNDAD